MQKSGSAPPDYVLIDDMLSAHDTGLDLASWLAPQLSNTRFLLMTGNTDPKRWGELSASAFQVRRKPILAPVLNEWVRQVDVAR